VEGNGSSAGAYRVIFSQYAREGILHTDLTAEQVKELAALLNKFQKTSELYILRGTHRDPEGNLVTRCYKSGDWILTIYGEPSTYTAEQVAALLPEAKAKIPWSETVEVVRYVDFAVIA
jgi:carbohydrate-binding DOMON domain-containing protein